ncbi:hypothetical protein E1162_09275 [Rhodobacteraceae bacterium RKSG542]|uniref:hypothetical protein n=1 Tax=Pseudovibrio flavus TaxID=2529854 RepID=UPI0012BD36E8|nr:hypothetical protein [Pseudovibrio flavus]MTI17429.1 hypothetical protein [Pseudovibrio flavus]
MSHITIIDALMGEGKSTYAINHINKAYKDDLLSRFHGSLEDHKFLVVVPLLEEVKRYKAQCPNLRFVDPQPIEGRKGLHLLKLIEEGRNIVTTHSLFLRLTKDVVETLKQQGYTLILDEVLSCVDIYKDLKKSDWRLLQDDGLVSVDPETKNVLWQDPEDAPYNGKFNEFKALGLNGNIVRHRNTLLWRWPAEFLEAFKEVFIMTYMFNASWLCAHMNASGIGYRHMSLSQGALLPWFLGCDAEGIRRLQRHIDVYEGPHNNIAVATRKNSNPLSGNWLKKNHKALAPELKKSMTQICSYWAKVRSQDLMWTCYQPYKSAFKGRGYTKGFVACNAKGTNDYSDRSLVCYLINLLPNPVIATYWSDKGVSIDADQWALSEMLQWIWRSRIRKGEDIKVYIPSQRMRGLFKDWLSASNASSLALAA